MNKFSLHLEVLYPFFYLILLRIFLRTLSCSYIGAC